MESKQFTNNWELTYVEEGIIPRHFCITKIWSPPNKLYGREVSKSTSRGLAFAENNMMKVFLHHVGVIDPDNRIIFCPNCKTKAPSELVTIVKLSDMHKELEHARY